MPEITLKYDKNFESHLNDLKKRYHIDSTPQIIAKALEWLEMLSKAQDKCHNGEEVVIKKNGTTSTVFIRKFTR